MTLDKSLFASKQYETIIYLLLGTYAVLLVLSPAEGVPWYVLYVWTYRTVIGCLVLDVVLRMLFDRPDSLHTEKGIWFIFDVVATVIAFIPGYEPFRAIRLLRILSQWSATRQTITPLFQAAWQSKDVWFIVGILMLVNTLMGYDGFAESMPDLFGTLPDALLTSVSLVIGDSFRDVYDIAFETHFFVALFHMCVSLFTLLFILSLIIDRVFKLFK